MQKKKILVLLGNSDTETFSGTMADVYEAAAKSAGHEVQRMNIGALTFDPILHKGYKEIQPLEPDLVCMQEVWRWADHIVIVYPSWWCGMPAILKGLFDRMFLPGFAFNFDKTTKKVVQRLKGKTARVIVLIGTSTPFMAWFKYGDFANDILYGILGFSGMKAKMTAFGPCDKVSDATRKKWIQKVEKLGEKGG